MGRDYWNKRNPYSLERAIECFRNAIGHDSTYAQAYAGLADCHAAQACFETSAPSALWMEVERNALRAHALEPTLAESGTALALKKAVFDWQWRGSEAAFREVLSLRPEYPTAHHWYGFFCLSPQRRIKAALEEVGYASTLDPLSAVIATHLGCLLYFSRAFDDAAKQLIRAIEIDPSFYLAYVYLGFAQIQISLFEQAKDSFQEARELGWADQASVAALGYLNATTGNREEAQAAIQAINCLAQREYISPIGLALVHGGLRNFDEAFQFLHAAIAERSAGLIHLKIDPAFDTLKTDHRFINILKTLDLVD
jgi:tetratricopeptide (TPR) repeat protein